MLQFQEKIEDTKRVIRSCNSKDRQHIGQKKMKKKNNGDKILHRKLKLEQHEWGGG